jgi:hypothetical protein
MHSLALSKLNLSYRSSLTTTTLAGSSVEAMPRSLWEQGQAAPEAFSFLPAAALTLLTAAALLGLLGARRPVEAIFAFFSCICSVALGLFALGADYLAALMLLVYAGAVLIFFVFVLFTVDPR